ncbi:MAG: tRNA pseudouridine(55) synthase TruB [Coriobacteriia bacterium]|nr:tRNA pseudouridine(55) synthase TruB [Coriobacteriia bacterium]
MSARRGDSGLSGVLAIDKPQGMTSHDVVNRVRRIMGERRVGHAGTLDPMASGVLVVLVGPATRLAPYLTAAHKAYEARIDFGAETDTDDADGRVTATAPIPHEASDPFAAAAFVASLVGTHEQVPPAYSAIKRDGVTAYTAARKGEAIELEARTIEVAEARLIAVETQPPSWTVEFGVSKGTYIRALARDIGRALASAAHLGALRRTRSGAIDVSQTLTLEALGELAAPAEAFVDPLAALGVPAVDVSAETAQAIAHGKSLALDALADAGPQRRESPIALTREGRLLALYAAGDDVARPLVVLPNGVGGVA